MANFPVVTYSNIKHKVNGTVANGVFTYLDEDITPSFNNGLGGNTNFKVSYNAPYNKITGNLVANMRLLKFEVRVNTIENATTKHEYGPGEGALVSGSSMTNIAPDVVTPFEITITSGPFSGSASNTYVVCLLAQGEDFS